MVRRRVHHGGKFAAIISVRMPATLHALDHINILGKDRAPHFGVGGAHLGEFLTAHSVVGIIDLDLLMRSAGAVGKQQDGEGMVVMDTQQDIRKEGDIFGAGVPM